MNRNEQLVKERIANDLKDHVITAIKLDGLHRHYRCQKPGTWNMGFDVVTWPGSLCYTGDMGDYLFQRTSDMIAFMRGSAMSYSYAAEKCVAHDGRLREWSEERFNQILADRLKDSDDGMFTVVRRGKRERESIADKIEEIKRAYAEYGSSFDAEKAMFESGLWDGCEMPDCKEYTFHFLWCLHALKWFTDKVAAGEVVMPAEAKAVPA